MYEVLLLCRGNNYNFKILMLPGCNITINISNVKQYNECILIFHLCFSKEYFSIVCISTKSTNIEFFLKANLLYTKNLSGYKVIP